MESVAKTVAYNLYICFLAWHNELASKFSILREVSELILSQIPNQILTFCYANPLLVDVVIVDQNIVHNFFEALLGPLSLAVDIGEGEAGVYLGYSKY